MSLHLPTLGAVFLVITVVLGGLLLFSWALNRQVRALAWWGVALFLIASAMSLVSIGASTPSLTIIMVANLLVAAAYGVLYAGCRVFNDRTGTLRAVATGPAIWAVSFPLIMDDMNARVAVMSVIAIGYGALSAWEVSRHARQSLKSQTVLVFFLLLIVAFNCVRGYIGFALPHTFWGAELAQRWSAPMAMILVVLIPTLAFLFLSMAKEKIEQEYKRAALVDSLTGIPNRRAFFQGADALLAKPRHGPVSCMVFDLDNFKTLNDRYGHEVGDHVLKIFGEVLSSHLRGSTFGRLGGEEFAGIVNLGKQDAKALAENIRNSFSSIAKIVRGVQIEVTVSVGCSTGTQSTAQELLHQADVALYEAKAHGRNAVVSFKRTEG